MDQDDIDWEVYDSSVRRADELQLSIMLSNLRKARQELHEYYERTLLAFNKLEKELLRR